MKLTKYEQSGFILETERGFRLGFDIGRMTPIEKLDGLKPLDAFLVSHIHGDHFSPEHIAALKPTILYVNNECWNNLTDAVRDVTKEIIVIKGGEKIVLSDTKRIGNWPVKITLFDVDHGPNISAPIENLGFLIEGDGEVIYFAGDMFYESGIDVTSLEVTYALIPVGTFYTFGPEEAFGFVKKFKKIGKIISMHYEKTPETKGQFLDLVKDSFVAE